MIFTWAVYITSFAWINPLINGSNGLSAVLPMCLMIAIINDWCGSFQPSSSFSFACCACIEFLGWKFRLSISYHASVYICLSVVMVMVLLIESLLPKHFSEEKKSPALFVFGHFSYACFSPLLSQSIIHLMRETSCSSSRRCPDAQLKCNCLVSWSIWEF